MLTGETNIDDFIKASQQDADLTEAQLETIFRTNIQSAFNAGRWKAQTDPDISGFVVGLGYAANGDNRTRGQVDRGKKNPGFHWQQHGFIAAATDYFWKKGYPINGYNCRCTAWDLLIFEARRLGYIIDGQLDPARFPGIPSKGLIGYTESFKQGLFPDPGFANNPGFRFN